MMMMMIVHQSEFEDSSYRNLASRSARSVTRKTCCHPPTSLTCKNWFFPRYCRWSNRYLCFSPVYQIFPVNLFPN
ncbi:hypothetical protein EG68_06695 [Paragonimus skrjabini miyazakii]|uniref:Uncharacterized protein n=1 Tax=Paragonimus skrjabini miyazakii TaxID=59628 RepID=A0A8S9YY96_9TREM|nr:hypothetical protein EG68_06695 [Paragonimus skrjabini miyazakii]